MPDLIVRGSIWLAIACFVAAHAGFRREATGARTAWALPAYWVGFALALTHFLAAFHWRYGWSHARAVAVTAVQTGRVFGMEWGGGVWVNYAFLATWMTDAVLRTRTVRGWRADAWVLRAFYLIVIANGAIVFVAWPINVLGAALVAALVWAWRPGRRNMLRTTPTSRASG